MGQLFHLSVSWCPCHGVVRWLSVLTHVKHWTQGLKICNKCTRNTDYYHCYNGEYAQCWPLWIFTLVGYRASEMGFRDDNQLAQLHSISESNMRAGTKESGHESFINNLCSIFMNWGMPYFLRSCSWNLCQSRNQSPWIVIMPLLLSSLTSPWVREKWRDCTKWLWDFFLLHQWFMPQVRTALSCGVIGWRRLWLLRAVPIPPWGIWGLLQQEAGCPVHLTLWLPPGRWHRLESIFLRHPWAHPHHDPWDWAQPGPLPHLPRHLRNPVLQRPLHGDRALLWDRRPLQWHQPSSETQVLRWPGAREWHLRLQQLLQHSIQQLYELCR